MNTLFISRKEHDAMLSENPERLRRLFAECARRTWSLAGVRFYFSGGIPE